MSGSPAPNGRVLLVALTPESRAALGAPEREITSFPYRVGRDSRGIQPTPHGFVRERRNPGSHPSGGALEVHNVVKRAQRGSDFDLDRLVALCPACHAQTDAPYARGRLVVTPLGDGRFTFEVIRGIDKWATRS